MDAACVRNRPVLSTPTHVNAFRYPGGYPRVSTASGGPDRIQLGSCFHVRKLVLPERIELSTSPLPRECSTTELRQQARLGKPKTRGGRKYKIGPRLAS